MDKEQMQKLMGAVASIAQAMETIQSILPQPEDKPEGEEMGEEGEEMEHKKPDVEIEIGAAPATASAKSASDKPVRKAMAVSMLKKML